MKRIQLSAEAEQDLVNGFEFYESQELSLGRYFLSSLSSDIDSLMVNAGVHQKFQRKFFILNSKRFPYHIYYLFNADTITVVAILDMRQDPESITQRFS